MANRETILIIIGTRPEAIKLAPIIRALSGSKRYHVQVCVTAQHREMLDQVLQFFDIAPDHDLDIMQPGQTLAGITVDALKGLTTVMNTVDPSLVMVQGDTTTAFAGALAGFYHRSAVVHVEAGLRSHDRYSPYPEEMNRVLAGHIAEYHFAPTRRAAENLRAEGITKNVWVVGNPVIDALHLGLSIIREQGDQQYKEHFRFLDRSRRLVLVTGHRRESFGAPFERICHALRDIVESFADTEILYPVHLNPNVRDPVHDILGDHKRIHLVEPLSYPYLIWLMERSFLVITDSGGIQEEAPSLGKPVLVMRDITERTEGIEAGTARLVGTQRESIVANAQQLLANREQYESMARASNPYGDGTAAVQICSILEGV